MSKKTPPSNDIDDEIDLGAPCGRVKKAFYDSVERRARERMQHLPSGEVVTAEWLLGVTYWQGLSPLERQRAGRCISLMQAINVLPLTPLPNSKKRPTRYYLLP